MKGLEDETVEQLNTDVTFTCKLSKPKAKVVWSKGKNPIVEGEKYTITNVDCQYTLRINDVTPEDESDYTISVKGKKSTAELFIDGEENDIFLRVML